MSVEKMYNEGVSKIKKGFTVMINICRNCRGIIGNETVCPKCGVNLLDYKEELEAKSKESFNVEIPSNVDSKSPLFNNEQTPQEEFDDVFALVKCPACGRDRVSDSAIACPECGFAIKQYFDKIKLEEKRKTRLSVQLETQKQRQEDNAKRKSEKKNKLFGSPQKIAAWISVCCIVLGLFVILGFYIHKEKEILDHIEHAQMWFDDIKEDVDKLQNELEDFDRVSDHEPTIIENKEMESIEKLVKNISLYKDMAEYNIGFDERVVISFDSYIKRNTSYKSWDEYKNFLENKYLVSNTPENSAAQLIKARTYSSYEELWAAKRKKSLFVDSVYISTNSSYHVVSGSVTNNTSSTVKFVVVEIHLKDEDGKTFDTDTTYACGEEGIQPGASAKFECYLDKDNRTDSCSASILRYD